MSQTGAPETVTAKRRIWPITATLVVFALLLFLYQGFVAAITTAPFFGDIPSRDQDIEAGMACVTTLPVFAAMIWCGWQRGSRRGLWLIGGLAAVMAFAALSPLGTTGDSGDPHPGRAPGLADLFGGSAPLNWVAFVVFAGLSLATYLQRRARHAETGSAA